MTLRHVRRELYIGVKARFSHIFWRGGELLGRANAAAREFGFIGTHHNNTLRAVNTLPLYKHIHFMRERDSTGLYFIRYTLNNAGNLFYLRRHFSIFISHTHQRHYLNYITRVNIICSASARVGPHHCK